MAILSPDETKQMALQVVRDQLQTPINQRALELVNRDLERVQGQVDKLHPEDTRLLATVEDNVRRHVEKVVPGVHVSFTNPVEGNTVIPTAQIEFTPTNQTGAQPPKATPHHAASQLPVPPKPPSSASHSPTPTKTHSHAAPEPSNHDVAHDQIPTPPTPPMPKGGINVPSRGAART